MKSYLLLVLAFLIVVTGPMARAAEIGDAAAPLQVAEWIKGQPVDLDAVKGKQVVVVDFWATWMPDCQDTIPRLTELQRKFKDVIFIGITSEDPAVVKNFVTKAGDRMDYRVAVDKDKETGRAYLNAFGIGRIPHTFVVDKDGRFAWNGQAMIGLEETLENVLAGKHDLERAKKQDVARRKMEEFRAAVAKGDDPAKVQQLGKELEALDAELGGLHPGQKFNAAQTQKAIRFQVVMNQFQRAIEADVKGEGETNKVQQLGKELEALDAELGDVQQGKKFNAADAEKAIRFQVVMTLFQQGFAAEEPPENLPKLEQQLVELAPPGFKFAELKGRLNQTRVFGEYYRVVTGRGDAAKLPELTQKLGETEGRNAQDLNDWAWLILTDQRIKTHDLALATRLAKAAVESTQEKDAAFLDTYARALFLSGQHTEAVEWQKKAIAVATDEKVKNVLQGILKQYEAKLAQ